MWSGETESGKVSSIREWRGVMYSRSKQGEDYHQIIGHDSRFLTSTSITIEVSDDRCRSVESNDRRDSDGNTTTTYSLSSSMGNLWLMYSDVSTSLLHACTNLKDKVV